MGFHERRAKAEELRCSFCGRDVDRVKGLIAGPGVFICDECVLLCVEALGEKGLPVFKDMLRIIREARGADQPR